MARRRTLQKLAWSAVILSAAILLIFSVPQLRSLAQEIIELFVQTESDDLELEITLPPEQPTEPSPVHILGGSRATFENAMSYVDFSINEPTVPEPYELIKITVRGPWVVAQYRPLGSGEAHFPEGTLFIGTGDLTTWEPDDDSEIGRRIGVSAHIIPINLGNGVQAEYVAGAWVDPATEDFGHWKIMPTENGGIVQLVWDNDYPAQYLRWEYKGLLYTVYGYRLDLDQADLTAIAISMMTESVP